MEEEQIHNDEIASPSGRHEFAKGNAELLKIILFVILAILGITYYAERIDRRPCQTIKEGGNIGSVLKEMPGHTSLHALQQLCNTRGLPITEAEIRTAISNTIEEGGAIPSEIFTSEPSDK